MATKRKSPRKNIINMAVAGLAIAALGAGTATAAISFGPERGVNPTIRPLTINRGATLAPAFGPDDEDCVYATRKVASRDGTIQIVRQLVCAD